MQRPLQSLAMGLALGTLAGFSALGFLARPLRAATAAVPLQVAQARTAQNPALQPEMQLQLSAAKQVKVNDQLSWQPLEGQARIQPGDVIRFTLSGRNSGKAAAQGLVMQQPIPPGTSFVARSARGVVGPKPAIAYSIDGGQTYSPQPTVKLSLPDGRVVERPAPVEHYTHVQLRYNQAIAPGSYLSGEYQVRVP